MPFLRRNLSYSRIGIEEQYSLPNSDGIGDEDNLDLSVRNKEEKKNFRIIKFQNRRQTLKRFRLRSTGGVDVLSIIQRPVAGRLRANNMLLKPHRRFPPYVPLTSEGWQLPHPPSTALALFRNKVQNSHNVTSMSPSSVLRLWDALGDRAEFWREEAKWDARRYRYQKQLYDSARFSAERIGSNNATSNNVAPAGGGSGFVVFSYYYHDDFGKMRVQLEKSEDRRCPFCFYDGRNDIGLVMHCKTVHSHSVEDDEDDDDDCENTIMQGADSELGMSIAKPTISFEAGLDINNNLHIMVKSLLCPPTNKCIPQKAGKLNAVAARQTGYQERTFVFARYHQSFCSDSSAPNLMPLISLSRQHGSPLDPSIPLVSLPRQHTSLLDPKTRKRKIRQLEQQSFSNPQIQKYAIAQYVADDKYPIRQYYHSKTMQPMAPGEWDIDSDEEADDSWSKTLAEKVLKELGDVSPKEKIFFNLWNRFMKSDVVIKDKDIPDKCEQFLDACFKQLIEHDLRNQFLLHLMNLWDSMLMPSDRMLALMGKYDDYDEMKDHNKGRCEQDKFHNSDHSPNTPSESTGVRLVQAGTTIGKQPTRGISNSVGIDIKHGIDIQKPLRDQEQETEHVMTDQTTETDIEDVVRSTVSSDCDNAAYGEKIKKRKAIEDESTKGVPTHRNPLQLLSLSRDTDIVVEKTSNEHSSDACRSGTPEVGTSDATSQHSFLSSGGSYDFI